MDGFVQHYPMRSLQNPYILYCEGGTALPVVVGKGGHYSGLYPQHPHSQGPGKSPQAFLAEGLWEGA